jgi:acetolactate synthase small subunit
MKFQDTKNKEFEKIQKQTNELIGALNKHQSERENTIIREINELKIEINNIRKEVTHGIENHRKKNETEKQNTVEGHSSRLELQKTESQNLKIKWKLKEKLKNC